MTSRDNIPERFLTRIRDAKDKQLEELDLSNDWNADDKDKLTKIPDEVFELNHLQVLKLNGNKIYELPESLGNLTRLTRLDLGENQLLALPESLGNLTNLTGLYLNRNQLLALPESPG